MSGLDGDQSAKSMDTGANNTINSASEFTDSIHENAHQTTAAGVKTTGQGSSVFDKTGAVGKQFTTEGTIGGAAQKLGGPLDKNGAIGSAFTTEGSLGGTAQSLADKNKGH